MGKAVTGIAIGAAIVGLAVATGGISIAPTIAASSVTVAGTTIATAAVAGGLVTTALGSIALTIGASMAISGLTSALLSPKTPSTQVDRLNLGTDPKAFRKTVLGSTAFPLDVRYQEWNGPDQDISDLIVTCAGHRVQSVDEIWINDEQAWVAGQGGVGKFVGYFFADWVLEGGPGQGFNLESGRWQAGQHRLTGCPVGHFRFKLSGNSKKAESPFSGGVPSRITVIGKGGMMYDPRRDSTVTGGSGLMRADDQATWRYFADDGAELGSNLPLQILRVLLGWRITNPATGATKLSVGCGLPRKRLHLESFFTSANLADEMVSKMAGGMEPRYAGAITCSEGDDPQQVLDALCAACNGRLVEIGGKIGLVIAHNDLAAAATDPGLNDDDVIGDFVWNPDPALDQCPNVVSGNYTDPSPNSLYQQIPYAEARLDSVDGIDRVMSFDLTAVESPSQASRICSQVLQRREYDRTFTAPFDIRAWLYAPGDVVPFTFAALSFTRKVCRVVEQEITQDGKCAMMLRIEHPDIYRWDGGDGALVLPAAPNVYDGRNSPIIRAIDDAATTAVWTKVLDDNGARPDDNAVNTRLPDAPLGPNGETVAEVLEVISTVGEVLGDLPDAVSAINLANTALEDSAAEQALVGLLLDEQAARSADGALTLARQEITQRLVDGDAAEASARLTLAVRTTAAEAALVDEEKARADADGAIVQTVTSAVARLNNVGDGETVEAAFVSTRQAAVKLVNDEAEARTEAIDAAKSEVGQATAAAIEQTKTEAGQTYAKAATLDAVEGRLDDVGGRSFESAISDAREAGVDAGGAAAEIATAVRSRIDDIDGKTIEATVSALFETAADLTDKAKARFQIVAGSGGTVAGIQGVVENENGNLTSELALIAKKQGFWLQRDDNSLVQAIGLTTIGGQPRIRLYGLVTADELDTNSAVVPAFWSLPSPVSGNGYGDTGGTIGGTGGGGGSTGGGGGGGSGGGGQVAA